MKQISIVIPVYNSAECVKELSRQIADAIKDYDYEQIMVNDCSKDNSWDEIKEVSKTNKNLIGINLRKNSGQDSAIFTGLSYSTGEWVVVMDDDLQHSPYDIPKLLEEAKKGYDVVFANFNHKKQKLWKNLGSWFNGKMSEIALKKPKGIYLSPFKIMAKGVVDEIVKLNNLYPYVSGLVFQITNNVTQINLEHHEREKGTSNYNLIRSLKYFSRMLFCFSTLPLQLTSWVGTFSAIAGVLLALYYLIEYFLGLTPVRGWTTLAVLTLIIGGCILVSLGIIGRYLGQIYLTVNNTPKFIVKETVNLKNE